MKKFFKLALFLPVLLLFSCEDVVQIKLDEGSKLYVIDAFVNDLRQDQVIRVSTNTSYFSNTATPGVSTASVILKDLTANLSYTFNYTSAGNYVYTLLPTDTLAKINHQYELHVVIDGVDYTSFAVQKRTASIDSIVVAPSEGFFGPPNPGAEIKYNCFLFAKDKADNQPDFYWIKTYRNDTLFTESDDINICIDGTGGEVFNAPQDSTKFTPPATLLSFKEYSLYDKCRVEIHSISRDNYFFFIQALNQINNQGLFATTPENVKTNIVTPSGAQVLATGRFNMASVATKSVLVQ